MRTILALAFGLACLTGAAHADDLQDCSTPSFRAAIGADAAFKCAEGEKQTYTANGQTFTVRAIRDASTNPQFVEQHAAETIDAILSSMSLFDDLAPQFGFEFGHVTVLMVDPERVAGDMKGEKFAGIFANADGFTYPRECIVKINIPKNDEYGLEALRNTAAHEVFHCVQFWSYPDAAKLAAGDWWKEGSAEFFAAQVQMDNARLENLGSKFIETIETTPLIKQPYNSVVFFAWLWSQGPDKMAAFFKGVSASDTDYNQMNSTLQSVGEMELQQFAQALIDGKIAMPSGYTFPAPPDQVATTAINDDDKQIELTVKPFTIVRHALHFSNGTYNAWAGGSSFYKREQSGGDWSELDPMETIEPESCKDIRMLLTARFVSDVLADKTTLVAHRQKQCLDCVKMPKVDQCVVGKWKMSNEALLTYLQATNGQSKMSNFSGVGGTAVLVFDNDGSAQFVVEGLKIGAEVKMAEDSDDVVLINVEGNGIDMGEWGTDEGGAMNYCAKSATISFKIRVELPNGYTNESEQEGMLQDSIWTYSCSGNELLLRYTGPNVLPDDVQPRWELHRIP